MAAFATHTAFFDALKAAGPNRADALARMEMIARLLDTAFVIPGTKQRFGLDAIIGLVPGVGDAITTALSSYIIWEARQLGLSRWQMARMIGNVALDGAVGAIPIVGDIFDVFFRANQRNMRIVRAHLEKGGAPGAARASDVSGAPGVIDGEYSRVGEAPAPRTAR